MLEKVWKGSGYNHYGMSAGKKNCVMDVHHIGRPGGPPFRERIETACVSIIHVEPVMYVCPLPTMQVN